MKNSKSLLPVIIVLMTVSLACSSLKNRASTETTIDKASAEKEDQIVMKEIAAAELDCHQAQAAIDHLVALEQRRRSSNLPSTADYDGKLAKLKKIVEKCAGGGSGGDNGSVAYRIAGGLDSWQTNTVVCDITKPFTLTGGGFTMKLSGGVEGTYEYTGPFNAKGTGTYEMNFPNGIGKNGEMKGRGDGTIQGGGKEYKGTGAESYTLTAVEGACVDGPVKK
jgi:hypothetical protein